MRSCESSLVAGAALRAAQKIERERAPATRRGAGPPGGRGFVSGASGERALGPAADLPDPAGQLARHGRVGLAGGLPRLAQRPEPPGQPRRAGVRARLHGGGDVRSGRRGLRPRRAARVVPRGLHERRAGEDVAGLGYPAAPLGLAARVLRRHEAAPARERAGRAEPGEAARLGGEQHGGLGVDALDERERLDHGSPAVRAGERRDLRLQVALVALGAAGARHVVHERVALRPLEPDGLHPPPVGARPGAAPPAEGVPLVPDEAQPDQEHVEPLAGALQVGPGVVEGAHEVAGRLGLLVRHPDLDDVVRGEHARYEERVGGVVLPAAVGRGALHLGDGRHGAVDAEGAQLAAEVEAGGAALVARPGLLEAPYPGGDLAGVRAERALDHLPGEGVERRRGNRAGVYVQTYGGNMGHGRPPPVGAVRACRTGRQTPPLWQPQPADTATRRGGFPSMLLSYRLASCRSRPLSRAASWMRFAPSSLRKACRRHSMLSAPHVLRVRARRSSIGSFPIWRARFLGRALRRVNRSSNTSPTNPGRSPFGLCWRR